MLISVAHAQQAAGAADPAGGLMQFLPIILMFVVLWFLMIRPQQKKAKEHQAMLAALAKGDEVVTGGGLIGRWLGGKPPMPCWFRRTKKKVETCPAKS